MTLRRAFGTLLAVCTLILAAPGAAMAYEGDDEGVAVSDTNPAPGQPFQVIVNAGEGSDEATLTITPPDGVPAGSITIDGVQTTSLTKATTAAGTAEFTVILGVEAYYTLVGLDEAGNRVGESVVVVGDAVAGVGGDDIDENGLGLPDTGAGQSSLLIGGAGALLLVGGGATLLYSRRRNQTT
ncbi:LPXTG cell wall anchor domain-containing protein [Nocardioides mesophilus]|uniref:LPXTG cell wall anchor domain-containing protein n=1 Tax=Nocardioides mesophilus TaxID=433659 RepID=A0A7G9REI5_9ACTN|nr:LPXTG cell wall anchor domain-containing protein [Nocardioides mesophilus]QNN54010.1 LPXTG cell wall anchor domain-containing protein [Nocardioides mesophilus]